MPLRPFQLERFYALHEFTTPLQLSAWQQRARWVGAEQLAQRLTGASTHARWDARAGAAGDHRGAGQHAMRALSRTPDVRVWRQGCVGHQP